MEMAWWAQISLPSELYDHVFIHQNCGGPPDLLRKTTSIISDDWSWWLGQMGATLEHLEDHQSPTSGLHGLPAIPLRQKEYAALQILLDWSSQALPMAVLAGDGGVYSPPTSGSLHFVYP